MSGFHSNRGRVLATLLHSALKWNNGETEGETKFFKKIVSVVGI